MPPFESFKDYLASLPATGVNGVCDTEINHISSFLRTALNKLKDKIFVLKDGRVFINKEFYGVLSKDFIRFIDISDREGSYEYKKVPQKEDLITITNSRAFEIADPYDFFKTQPSNPARNYLQRRSTRKRVSA